MMNLKIFAENLRKLNIKIFVMLDLKREIKEGSVYSLKAKKPILNALTRIRIKYMNHLLIQIKTPLKI